MCRVDVFDVSEGVRFTLKTWDTDRSDHMGKSIVAYVLQGPDGVIFEGCDFACSPLHATDSDDCISALLGFLTLRRGDVDEGSDTGLKGLHRGSIGLIGRLQQCIGRFLLPPGNLQMGVRSPDFVFDSIAGSGHLRLRLSFFGRGPDRSVIAGAPIENIPLRG